MAYSGQKRNAAIQHQQRRPPGSTRTSTRSNRHEKNDIVFHHDNARPQVERRVESIANKGWGLLPHPPYSPSEAPTDYHVNRSLKNWQVNKIYDDLDDLETDVKARFVSKNSNFFAHGIDCLPSK